MMPTLCNEPISVSSYWPFLPINFPWLYIRLSVRKEQSVRYITIWVLGIDQKTSLRIRVLWGSLFGSVLTWEYQHRHSTQHCIISTDDAYAFFSIRVFFSLRHFYYSSALRLAFRPCWSGNGGNHNALTKFSFGFWLFSTQPAKCGGVVYIFPLSLGSGFQYWV